jgi:hypothetical protein
MRTLWPIVNEMTANKIKLGLVLLILSTTLSTNGQGTKKFIEDAWWYLDTFENFKTNQNIDLVKNWHDEKHFCVVSFEKGLFTLNGETDVEKQEGSWRIDKVDGKEFITITNNAGLFYKFEVLTADKNKLKLKKVE